jgi:hypothetical protein
MPDQVLAAINCLAHQHKTMNTNPNTRDDPWFAFRDRLFDGIESRRAIACTFEYEDVYHFINRCATAFDFPGTDKAKRALAAIADEGTFRLVSDSFRDFSAMFPTAGSAVDSRASGGANRPAAVERRQASEPLTYQGSAAVHSPPPRAAEANQPPARTSQHSLQARGSSGRPF